LVFRKVVRPVQYLSPGLDSSFEDSRFLLVWVAFRNIIVPSSVLDLDLILDRSFRWKVTILTSISHQVGPDVGIWRDLSRQDHSMTTSDTRSTYDLAELLEVANILDSCIIVLEPSEGMIARFAIS
jgi:hypothetical protein